MSRCDNCGRTMGHSDTVSGEYRAGDLPEEFRDGKEGDETVEKFFGDSMCKDVFEEELEVQEKINCYECGELLQKKDSVTKTVKLEGVLKQEREVHPKCKSGGQE